MARRQRISRRVRRRRRIFIAALILVIGVAVAYFRFVRVDTHGAEVAEMTIASKAVGDDLRVAVVSPAGARANGRKPPLLVFLHGKGEPVGNYTSDGAFFKALADLGGEAPVVAFPEDDGDSYWHDRRSGGWGTYVVNEVLPEVARRFDTDPDRFAIGGISMGGFGAYNLALHNPGRFCAVGGHSPALWLEGGETAPSAFDDAEDFEGNNVIGRLREDPNAFGPIPIWNDAGDEDPFAIGDRALLEALDSGQANLESHTWPGSHEHSYWAGHWAAYLAFYANAFRNCG